MPSTPEGYLGAEGPVPSGPAPELIEAGYARELADAPLLHRGLGLADLAHVVALAEIGAVPAAEAARLAAALLELLDIPPDRFPYDPVYGDAYNSRERELERRLGTTAGWLPTGRTRREAGRIAFRLALRALLLDLHAAVADLADALATREDEEAATVFADMTYLQPAQPSSFGHYLGSFAEESARHLERIQGAWRWADRSPAGVGGVAGPRVPLDRGRLAELLGFGEVGAHTRDAMWAVDGLIDAVAAATQAALTIDRLAEDLEIFTSPGFGYVALDPSFCRASVLMPQKRNPYALAVIRGGASTLIGRTAGMLTGARTPSARTDNWLYAYGEVAGALQLGRRLVALGAGVVRTLAIHREALADAAAAGFTGAADLAEQLMLASGLDYRTAYRVVARAVTNAAAAGSTSLAPDDLARAAREVGAGQVRVDSAVLAALEPRAILATRTVPGGASPQRVQQHAARIHRIVAEARRWERDRRLATERAEARLLAAARDLAGTA